MLGTLTQQRLRKAIIGLVGNFLYLLKARVLIEDLLWLVCKVFKSESVLQLLHFFTIGSLFFQAATV